jgi:type II secretory pathway pseudopilin PulG
MFTSHRRAHGFTLVEALVIVVLAVLIAAVILPALIPRRLGHNYGNNLAQIRGIHTGLVLYAQGNGTYYPGLDNTGKPGDLTVEYRFRELLEDSYFTGEYAISPYETKTPWTQGPVTSQNYSFAMLHIASPGRALEWRETMNTDAPVLSDRAIANGPGAIRSYHERAPEAGVMQWRGAIAWNDNHVTFEPDPCVDTKYDNVSESNDELFYPASDSDAWMIYTGTNGMGR